MDRVFLVKLIFFVDLGGFVDSFLFRLFFYIRDISEGRFSWFEILVAKETVLLKLCTFLSRGSVMVRVGGVFMVTSMVFVYRFLISFFMCRVMM